MAKATSDPQTEIARQQKLGESKLFKTPDAKIGIGVFLYCLKLYTFFILRLSTSYPQVPKHFEKFLAEKACAEKDPELGCVGRTER